MTAQATTAEIREAYRRRARLLHPDHHGTENRSAQVAAAAEMARVNEAWRVLQDPGRRAAYDRSLRATPPRSSTSTQPPSNSARPAYGSDFVRDDDEDVDDFHYRYVRPTAGERTIRMAPWIAIAVVMFVIFVATAVLAGTTADNSTPKVDTGHITVGSCLLAEPGRPVASVPCSARHDGRAAAVIPIDQACPDGTDYYMAPDNIERVCVALGL